MAAALLIVVALLLLAIELKFGTYGAAAIPGALLLSLGMIALVHDPERLNPVLPISVSIALALIAIFQGYLGFRARRNAHLAGNEELVGKIGVTRTAVGNSGTVFVRGEYWQAQSREPIPQGAEVRIESVEGLTLHVKEA
jgi:membrane-bound serine protease (ClpP class)